MRIIYDASLLKHLKKVESVEAEGIEIRFKRPVGVGYAFNRLLLAIVWKRLRSWFRTWYSRS
jgi:hypothetical protein